MKKQQHQIIQQQPLREYTILKWFETITLIRETEIPLSSSTTSLKSEDTIRDDSISEDTSKEITLSQNPKAEILMQSIQYLRYNFTQFGKKPLHDICNDIIQYMLQIERIKKLIVQHLNNPMRKDVSPVGQWRDLMKYMRN